MAYHRLTETPAVESRVAVSCEVCYWRFEGKGRGSFALALARAHVLRNPAHDCTVTVRFWTEKNVA